VTNRRLGFILGILSMFSFPIASFSSEDFDEVQTPNLAEQLCNPTRWAIQARGVAFLPLKSQLSDIYGTAWPTVQLESSYRLKEGLAKKCDQLLLWENIGWTWSTGETEGFGYYTGLNYMPISIGIEYEIPIIEGFDFYAGIAPSYNFLWITNYDGFSTNHLFRSQFGFTTKTGFRYTFCTNYFIDVFGDYSFTEFSKMNNDSIQNIDNHFGGFNVGGGFGGKF
jgi:hypothetical protein